MTHIVSLWLEMFKMKIIALLFLILLLNVTYADEVGFARIIDGDTISINEQTIRLTAIDAPETAQYCDKVKCGQLAINYLKTLIANNQVRCEGDQLDIYKRILAVCYVGKININQQMVASGHAVAYLKYSDLYEREQIKAKQQKLGIWATNFIAPSQFRASKWTKAVDEKMDAKCPIKGNINKKGQRIYHTPYSKSYSKTKISKNKGERWFCSEIEAVNAGWRAPYN